MSPTTPAMTPTAARTIARERLPVRCSASDAYPSSTAAAAAATKSRPPRLTRTVHKRRAELELVMRAIIRARALNICGAISSKAKPRRKWRLAILHDLDNSTIQELRHAPLAPDEGVPVVPPISLTAQPIQLKTPFEPQWIP